MNIIEIESWANRLADTVADRVVEALIRKGVVYANPRGRKNTPFMQGQRTEIARVVIVERHARLEQVTLEDCRQVWAQHRASWDFHAELNGDNRGYLNVQSAYAACKHWFADNIEQKRIMSTL